MVKRTKEAAQETRNQLLDAAELVFNERGVARTSMHDIAVAAGVTRGAVYWHFRNKADLFNAMMERVTLPLEEIVAQAGDADQGDPLGLLRRSAIDVLVHTATDLRMQRVFDIVAHKCEYVDEMAPLRQRHLEGISNCLAQMEAGFRNAVAKGQLPATLCPRRAAIGLHALVDGLIVNWLLEPQHFSLVDDAEAIVDTYLQGLASPAPAVRPTRHRRVSAGATEAAGPAPLR